jgi:hypothetical protein
VGPAEHTEMSDRRKSPDQGMRGSLSGLRGSLSFGVFPGLSGGGAARAGAEITRSGHARFPVRTAWFPVLPAHFDRESGQRQNGGGSANCPDGAVV